MNTKKNRIYPILMFVLAIAIFCTACGGNRAESAAKNAEYAEPMMMAAYESADSVMMDNGAMMNDGVMMEQDTATGYSDTSVTQTTEEQTTPEYGGRKIIRTLSIALQTDAFDEQIACLKRDTSKFGGYVQSSYVYGTKPEIAGDNGRTADYTVRIPADKVDAFMQAAVKYGELLSQNEDTQDITDSYFDIETRLEVNRKTLARLESILDRTETMEDIVALEQEISRVTYDIEDLTTNLRRYDGMISYATVNISMTEKGMAIGPAAKTPFGARVSTGFNKTLNWTLNSLEDFAVTILSLMPIFLPLIIVAVVVGLLRRYAYKRDVANGMPAHYNETTRRLWHKERKAYEKGKKIIAQNAKKNPPIPEQNSEKPEEKGEENK